MVEGGCVMQMEEVENKVVGKMVVCLWVHIP